MSKILLCHISIEEDHRMAPMGPFPLQRYLQMAFYTSENTPKLREISSTD